MLKLSAFALSTAESRPFLPVLPISRRNPKLKVTLGSSREQDLLGQREVEQSTAVGLLHRSVRSLERIAKERPLRYPLRELIRPRSASIQS